MISKPPVETTTTSEWIPDDVEGGPYRPTPEDFLPREPPLPGPLNWFPPVGSMREPLALWVLFWGFSLLYWRGHPVGDLLWVSKERVFVHGEWWRLFTALFTHSGVDHLLANTPLFVIFGTLLRGFFGLRAFPFAAFFLGALANAFTVWNYPDTARLVGASGMVYAMVAYWLVLYVRHDKDYPWGLRLVRATGFALAVMFPTTFDPSTSYLAHAAGFGLGILLAFATLPWVKPLGTG